jgi:hypothetical protein
MSNDVKLNPETESPMPELHSVVATEQPTDSLSVLRLQIAELSKRINSENLLRASGTFAYLEILRVAEVVEKLFAKFKYLLTRTPAEETPKATKKSIKAVLIGKPA